MIKKIRIITIISSTTIAFGSIGGIVYGIYSFSKSQKENKFLYPEITKINEFFNGKEQEVLIKEKVIAGEKGYVVNSGPIRITTAYKSLFTKDTLISLAKWVNQNIAWGANAITLKSINFTTGIDKSKDLGTTKGFHTAERDGSAIYISPDAFEDLNQIGDDVFRKILTPTIEKYRQSLQKDIAKIDSNKLNDFVTIPKNIDKFLREAFNGAASLTTDSGKYKNIQQVTLKDILTKMIDESWNDDYISKVASSQLQTASATTLLGNLYFSNPERLAYLIEHNKLDKGLEKLKMKQAFIIAYKSVLAATGGKVSLGNTYLSLALKNILFQEGRFKDKNDKAIMYKLRSRKEWDKASGTTASDSKFNSLSLPINLKAGYFKKLQTQGISNKTINLRIAIYKLFLHFYDKSMQILNTKNSVYKNVNQLWKDKTIQVINAWLNSVRTRNSSTRARWILTGKYSEVIKLNVLESDEWMLDAEDKKFINQLSKTNIFGRQISVDMEKTYKEALSLKLPIIYNKTITEYYRYLLIDSMKYTLSHEYGHHETMWSSFGVYGKSKKNIANNFEDTINIYSERLAAQNIEYVHENILTQLVETARRNNNQGLLNAIEIILKSSDKSSETWTPSYVSGNYYGFNPTINGQVGSWSHVPDDMFDPNILFYRDASGREQIKVGKTKRIGQNPMMLKVLGVDSQGKKGFSNYLFAIDKSKLKDDNPAKVDKARIDEFLKLFITPDELLYGYQISKWIIENKQKDQDWLKENDITLPNYDTQGLTSPTTKFAPILAQDPTDQKTKMMTFFGILQLQFSLKDKYVLDIIKQVNDAIGKLYNSLIKEYPNLYEKDKNGNPKMSSYKRAKIIFKKIIKDTRDQITESDEKDPYDALKSKNEIFYDPKSISYKNLNIIDIKFEDFLKQHNGRLETKGTIVLGQAKSALADYTGNLAEFMTRAINQIQFRPDYDHYLNDKNELDKIMLVKSNSGWYDDLNRFHALGLNLYNVGVKGETSSELTNIGANVINWYRQMIGLHVSDETNYLKKDGKVDYKKLNQAIVYAEPIVKIFKNRKTNLVSMWGWLPEKNQISKIKLTNHSNGKVVYVPIIQENTDNYFYYEDLNKDPSKKHSLTKGYKQWVAKWQVTGDYMNADIKQGKYDLTFIDKNGKEISLLENKKQSRKIIFNNDYLPIFAEIIAEIDKENKRMVLVVK